MAGFAATVGAGLLEAACSARSDPVGPGGECFLATDCAPGLVCIEQPNKSRVCSDDLSRVVGRTPPDGAANDEDAGEGGVLEDGDVPDAPPPPPPQDAGSDTGGGEPDSGSPPPTDSGSD